jgi:uncharacterized membrane protein
MDMLQQIFLGLALASAAGLRAFLPLLGLSLATHFGYVHLNEHFAWLGSGKALIVLAVAAVAEMLADKVPVVDHALDLLQTVIRPAAGALAMAGTQQHLDPMVGAVLGLILGGSLAGGLHAAKGGVRLASTVTTAGLANPLLSLAEDGTSLGLTVLALVSPLLGFLLALLIVFGAWQGWRRLSRRRAQKRVL